ncbi:MAG: hypothetical protein HOQ01_04800, partial [Lysobacter sp.]|nr:hypothetical protein [Lysobacter sp.]
MQPLPARKPAAEIDAQRSAAALMRAYAERTGLIGHAAPQRYLWTDAFAVCNFIALDEIECAERLIEQVHE